MAHSVSRSEVLAGLAAVALLAFSSPALAVKKKKAVDPFDNQTGSAEPGLPTNAKADGASQAADQERPKPILEEEAPSPEADERGNVNFGGTRAGKGKIVVKAPAKEKAKVYLEGHYFGVAPRTINKIPPGDYIVEVVYPDGKSVTKPVSVVGDEESLIELGTSEEEVKPVAKPMAPEQVEKRLRLAKVIGISAIALGVVGGGLGLWEMKTQSDYNKTPASDRQKMMDLQHRGDTLALAANICFVGAAAGLIVAGVVGYPAWKARRAERSSEAPPDVPPPMSFYFGPGRTIGSLSTGVVYTF